MAAGLRTIVLAGLVVGGINGFVFPDLKLADVLSIRDRLAGALGPNAEPLFDAIQATAIAKRDPSNADTGLTRTLTEPEARRTASSDPPEVLAPEAPVRLAALTPLDQVHADTNEALVVFRGESRDQKRTGRPGSIPVPRRPPAAQLEA
jgi:hypothetical protein